MPTAPDRTYTLNKVVPMYPGSTEDQPQRLRFALPANKTYSAGQVMAENRSSPGLADAVSAVAAPAPAAPTIATATAGGTLLAGTYGYRITGNTVNGETAPSTEVTIATTGTTSTITLTLPALTAGITSYNVYGRTVGGERLMATGQGAGAYTDTGAAATTGAPLPAGSAAWVTPNLANFLGILEFDCFTDASGNVFKGTAANPDNISTIGASIWLAGYFNVADLIGLTADVLALRKSAIIAHGSLTTGVVKI